ncbi:hypothetical protein CISG_09300 [Coccidioides immitis RMSCC 3703]|uniref:FAD-binding PCMH-type domain-containing protein n=2 Tax=Coccidioides immitis TaxID=5501 RepID=A0A0J8RCG6_COCIT|nr:hypothetical protein CIRG_02183 [Coccidioides immitis RMSCC 2394]KMU81568.1 hypothetical protein CISG_09300 [Coccidioides immitis RMSCC 3703]
MASQAEFVTPSAVNATMKASAVVGHRQRCSYGDSCWPTEGEWQSFNASVSGHLIRTYPSAAVCHAERYDDAKCTAAKENWLDSFWRTNQTGAYSAILWELGENGQCFIDSPRDAPCDQGIVPHYSVNIQSTSDIQTAVKFAAQKELYLTVKNTGHDHLGRSSGQGAFSLWTHNMKGREWHTSFIPKGAPQETTGIPAVTLQAGEQWLDVYRAAAENGVIVVGGSARTVGAAGGYLTGGGHSPFSHFYGLAVDNLLEVNLVDANGTPRTINQYTDPEYFYALRGGGGSAWGVITSVTYKTHPSPSHIQVGLVQFNVTNNSTLRAVIEKCLQELPSITDAGYTGYGSMNFLSGGKEPLGFGAIFIQPNGTNATFTRTFKPYYDIAKMQGVSGALANIDFPSWIEYAEVFVQDPNIATNIIDGSRLLTSQALLHRTRDLVDLMFEYASFGPGFNFIGKVSSAKRDETSTHPIWEQSRALLSFAANWRDDASANEKRNAKLSLVEISKKLGDIVGPGGGTYVNEANPYEPDWQNVFWGEKYARLLAIKKRIDPTNLFVCNRCVGTDIVLEP